MVSNPVEITDDSPIFPMTQTKVNKPSASKSQRLFTNIFDVKNITANCRVGYKNHSTDPLNLDVACVKIEQNVNGIQKSMNRSNRSFING